MQNMVRAVADRCRKISFLFSWRNKQGKSEVKVAITITCRN
jgi:hypothetical protein